MMLLFYNNMLSFYINDVIILYQCIFNLFQYVIYFISIIPNKYLYINKYITLHYNIQNKKIQLLLW